MCGWCCSPLPQEVTIRQVFTRAVFWASHSLATASGNLAEIGYCTPLPIQPGQTADVIIHMTIWYYMNMWCHSLSQIIYPTHFFCIFQYISISSHIILLANQHCTSNWSVSTDGEAENLPVGLSFTRDAPRSSIKFSPKSNDLQKAILSARPLNKLALSSNFSTP